MGCGSSAPAAEQKPASVPAKQDNQPVEPKKKLPPKPAPLVAADAEAPQTPVKAVEAPAPQGPVIRARFDPKAKLGDLPQPKAPARLVSPKAAYTVDSLFQAAHDGHDLGRKGALLFDKFDTDHNGVMDDQELANLTKAMLEHTLQTLIDVNNDMVEKAVKERPQDEETIRSEAKNELDMIVPYAQSQVARSKEIALEMRAAMDSDGNGSIDKEEFISKVTDCLKTYADFNVC